ncbi:SNF2 family domain-containing protein [Colletotrichum salicis]|uniref:SNF2 family domain-containing protein n=1 Tax=Colletotrichum salicis TaxID=1209931 RepID=A0A135UVD5_9PEZI|nr:SNF2 family domain-containing protein [Colletotrichum salicis]
MDDEHSGFEYGLHSSQTSDGSELTLQLPRDEVQIDSVDGSFGDIDSELFVSEEHPLEVEPVTNLHDDGIGSHISTNSHQRNNGLRRYVGKQDTSADNASDYDPHTETETDDGLEDGPILVLNEDGSGNDAACIAAEKSRKARLPRGPVAKTAKQYIARDHQKKHQNLKEHFRKEISKKRALGDDEVDIQPPKAKRRGRGRNSKGAAQANPNIDNSAVIQKTADMFHDIINSDFPPNLRNTNTNAASDGAIPASSQGRVTKASRLKQLAQAKTQGNDNRHSATQKKDLKEALHFLGHGKVWAVGENDYHLDGVNSNLRDCQLIAAAWMAKRENAETHPYGGVLADAPGMGKTVVSLACITGNPPDDEDKREWSRSTLIKHLKNIPHDDVYFFRRSGNTLSVGGIATFTIVLTAYNELLTEFPKGEKLDEMRLTHANDPAAYKNEFQTLVGELFRVNWYRVILDEGHQIKNLEARNFINPGCPSTQGKAFLAFERNASYQPWKRTEEDEFLGRKILDLPALTPGDQWVDLSQEERILYDTVGNHYENIHSPQKQVAILRRRQAISHPYGLEKALKEDIQPYSLKHMACRLRELEGNTSILHQIGTRAKSREVPPVPDTDDENYRRAFGKEKRKTNKKKRLSKQQIAAKKARKEKLAEKAACDHMFCSNCFMRKVINPKKKNCPVCDKEHNQEWEEATTLSTEESQCIKWDGDGDDSDDTASVCSTPSKTKKKSKKASERKLQVALRRETKRLINLKYGADSLGNLPVIEADDKAYIRIGMKILNAFLAPVPNSRLARTLSSTGQTIRLSFVKTSNMTGVMLNLEGIPFVYLTGTMTPAEKSKAVSEFRNNPDVKVLRQAFGRVFRMGQVKESHYVRILARDTIDEDIRNLQEEKREEIEEVLQDDGYVPQVLSEYEVMALTAPNAWAELKENLLREIGEENAVAEDAISEDEEPQIADTHQEAAEPDVSTTSP